MAGEHEHVWMLDGASGGFYCNCGEWVGLAGFTALHATIARLERAAAVFTRIHGQCDGCRYCEVEVSLRGTDGGQS